MVYLETEAIDVTYFELAEVLKSLNFKKVDSEFFRFKHKNSKAEVILDKKGEFDLVDKAFYLSTVFQLRYRDILKKDDELNERIKNLRKKQKSESSQSVPSPA